MTKDCKSLKTRIKRIMEITATDLRREVIAVARPDHTSSAATELRRKIAIIGRPGDAKPTSSKTTFNRQAQIQRKIIDEAEAATPVITDPKTDDRRYDDAVREQSKVQNPIAKNMNAFNKPAVVKDKKKAEKKGYAKHKGKVDESYTKRITNDIIDRLHRIYSK